MADHFIIIPLRTPWIAWKEKASEEDLQIADKSREAKGKGERERYTQMNVEF